MPRRRSKFFTVLVLDDQDQVRRLRLTARAVRVGIAALVVAGLAVALLLLGFTADRFTIAKLERELALQRAPAAETTAVGGSRYQPIDPALLAAADGQEPLAAVQRFFAAPISDWLDVPHRWPLRGWVTSEFGVRANPVTGEGEMHRGIDIAAPIGREVVAPAAGEVLHVGKQPGFGDVVVLGHGEGVTTYYGHLDQELVVLGQTLEEGQVFARSGNSGQSTGPHLHYEVRRFGVPVDPRPYLPEMGQAPVEALSPPPPAAIMADEPTPE